MKASRIGRTVLILFLLMAGRAEAQRFRGLDTNRPVRGVLRLNNFATTERLLRATVRLRNGGDLEIVVEGKQPYTLTGRWFAGQGDTVDVEISGGLGSANTTGKGTITVRRGDRLERVLITGESDSRRYILSFDAISDREDAEQLGFLKGMSIGSEGSGRINGAGFRNERFDHLDLRLKNGGAAEVRLSGQMPPTTFTGRWREAGRNRYDLDIDGGFGNAGATGRGSARLRGKNQLESLEFSGRNARTGDRYSVNFRANERSSGREEDEETDRNDGREDGNPDFRELNLNTGGSGNAHVGKENIRLSRAILSLRRGGGADIRLEGGPSPLAFSGRWSRRGRTVELTITDGFGDAGAVARGTLLLRNNNRLDRLEITGNVGKRGALRESFTLRFDGR